MPIRDSYINVRGLSFHYRDWGGEGRDVLLLHGLASNARFWDLVAPFLNEFHVVAVDQRGHGLTDKPDSGYEFPSFSDDATGIIESLGLKQTLLVGHSWGGNVGMQLAADYPQLLSGLVCIDGGIIDPSAKPGATWEETEKALTPPDFASMKLTWETFLNRAKKWGSYLQWSEHAEDFLKNNFEVQPDGYVVPRLQREKHMRIVRAIWDQRVSRLYPDITCPVLLMPARRNNPSESERSWQETKEIEVERAMKLMPNARMVWMEDSVHDVPIQRPEEVAQVIKDAVSEGFF